MSVQPDHHDKLESEIDDFISDFLASTSDGDQLNKKVSRPKVSF